MILYLILVVFFCSLVTTSCRIFVRDLHLTYGREVWVCVILFSHIVYQSGIIVSWASFLRAFLHCHLSFTSVKLVCALDVVLSIVNHSITRFQREGQYSPLCGNTAPDVLFFFTSELDNCCLGFHFLQDFALFLDLHLTSGRDVCASNITLKWRIFITISHWITLYRIASIWVPCFQSSRDWITAVSCNMMVVLNHNTKTS